MPKSSGEYKIPFRQGSQLHWVGREDTYWGADEWRDNYAFTATLTFDGLTSGRSAKYFTLKDEEGHEFTMFSTDLLDLIQRGSINHGVVSERWTFIKRGQNYGIKMVDH
jgi:hypothetical protein